jgi:hypothetical protein
MAPDDAMIILSTSGRRGLKLGHFATALASCSGYLDVT